MQKFLIFSLLVLITHSGSAQGSLDTGLIAYWPFSRNANDSTGHGYNGTVIGATLTFDRLGRDSMAYDFNGTNGFIQVPDDSAWAFGQRPFTIVIWVNFRIVTNKYIIGQSNGGGSTDKWMLQYELGRIRFHTNSPQTGPLYPVWYAWQPLVNQWYQIVVTREGNSYCLYVDSTLMATGQDTNPVRDSWAPLLIGRAEGTLTFNGQLDDIRIYNRALSAQEVRSLYSQVLTGLAKEPGFPTTFSLSQNYPNPFNPSTVISYQLAVTSHINLKVYDILGRNVAVLVNEKLKPGTYEVTWDASNNPSGVYYYTLRAGEFSDTKKMVLVK